jgi:predicted Na+-dependent transporter
MAANRSFGRGEGAALGRERSSHPAMNWLNTPLLFKPILDLGVLFVTALLMITVGMELEGRHFREVAQRKWTVGLLLGGQVVLLPLLGIAVAQALELPPHLSAGILLVAACPVGDIANFCTLIARGDAGVLFAVRNVGLATAVAITLLGRLEYAVFAAVYFATEVPLLFGAVALYRYWCARSSHAAKAPATPELYP